MDRNLIFGPPLKQNLSATHWGSSFAWVPLLLLLLLRALLSLHLGNF